MKELYEKERNSENISRGYPRGITADLARVRADKHAHSAYSAHSGADRRKAGPIAARHGDPHAPTTSSAVSCNACKDSGEESRQRNGKSHGWRSVSDGSKSPDACGTELYGG